MPRPSLAGCLARNLETHVECVPRPRQWSGFPATKPAGMPLFYFGADTVPTIRDDCPRSGRYQIPRILAPNRPEKLGGAFVTADGARNVGLRSGYSEIGEFPRLFTSLD